MKHFSQEYVNLIAGRARALSDPTRVRILDTLSRGEQSVGELAFSLSSQQSTVSKHLQVLFHAGLVQRRRLASAVIYSIASSRLLDWCRYLGTRQLSRGIKDGARRGPLRMKRKRAGRPRATARPTGVAVR